MQTVFDKPAIQPFRPVQLTRPVQTPARIPTIEEWISTGLSTGVKKTDLFRSMMGSGWNPNQAAQTLALSHEEYIELGFVANNPNGETAGNAIQVVDEQQAFKESIALKVVPRPCLDLRSMSAAAGERVVKVLHHRQAPDLVHFEGFMDDEECEAMITMAQPKLTRSSTVDNATGGSKVDDARTSFGMFFGRAENELIVRIESRISELTGWPVSHGEGMQVLRYLPGAEYKPHFDYFDPHQPGSGVALKRGGQRVGTLLMYLNTPEAGGETVFPDINFAVPPKRGDAVFFAYAQAHPCSLSRHGGAPVIAGEKWVATKWFREAEFSIPMPVAAPA